MFQDIKAVIFDLDGTLIDSLWIWREIDREYLASMGQSCPHDLQKEIEGMSFTETAQYFKDRFSVKEDIEIIKNTWLEMANNHYKENVKLKNGVKGFLESLHKKNIQIGMATSNDRKLVQIILNKYEIEYFFKTIVTSCDVKRGKPHPDVFLKACENMKTTPQECLVFEDTVAGVLGAKRAGMKVIGVYDEHSLLYHEEIKKIADDFILGYSEEIFTKKESE